MYTDKCLSPERSGIIGKSRDYNDYYCLCLIRLLNRMANNVDPDQTASENDSVDPDQTASENDKQCRP